MRAILLLFAWLSGALLYAQQLAHFDLILFQTSKQSDGFRQVSAPVFLSAFNPKGYNNQPAFFPSGELFLTVQTPDDTTQTEVFALDVLMRTRTRVTATTEAEYSPTPMPGGKRFSAIRVENDGTQRLWSFSLDRSDAGKPVFPNIRGVGYHCWLRDTLVALFIVGENDQPHSLVLAGTKAQKTQRIATNVGRGLQIMPDGKLAYIHKATDQTWFIKTFDLQKKASEILVKTLSGSEDFAVLPDGSLLAGSGPRLCQYIPGQSTDWKVIADLSKYGVKTITRLAVSKEGKVAVVVQ